MMRALKDLDRVDAGKAPRRGLRPEVRSATDRWVHGNTAKVASTYAKEGDPAVRPPRRRRRWVIALLLVLVIAGVAAAIPASRHAVTRSVTGALESPKRLLPAVRVTTHGPYAFMQTTAAGNRRPVTYNPCRAIDYTINSDLAPLGSRGIVQSAVNEVSHLTGLEFHYAGASHDAVHYATSFSGSVRAGDHPPVQIAWSSASDFTSSKGDLLGLGGSAEVHPPGHDASYVTGIIALRADELGVALQQPGGRAYVKAVVLHELGHVVGLDHVHDPNELMNPVLMKQRDFGPGDREGLALLGQGSCH